MRREKCGGCGSTDLRQFLDLGETPLADEFPTSVEESRAQQRYPLGAAVCGACWLVQLTEVVPDDVLWGGDYGFYTSGSPSLLRYFAECATDLAEVAVRTAGELRRPFIVEVACNDGTLLAGVRAAALRDYEVWPRALGVDPAKGPAEAARAKELDIIQAPFGREVAQAIVDTEGQASLVIANNVLAHVADLDEFVGGLALLLAPDGVLSVEVQYLGDLLLGNGFDLLYHEHRSFFAVQTLAPMLARRGLHVTSVRRTAAQGGSLRVTAVRRESIAEAGFARIEGAATVAGPERRWARERGTYEAMQGRADMVRFRLRDLVAAERAAGRTVVGYGAPAKATTLLHWCGLTSSTDIEVVYDATPSKDGRFMPGTDIPITTKPMEWGNTVLLLAHNYLGDVLRREWGAVEYGDTRFIVPLPVPVLL